MVETKDLEIRGFEFQEAEESLVYKDSEVFDTIILHDSIKATQSKLKTL